MKTYLKHIFWTAIIVICAYIAVNAAMNAIHQTNANIEAARALRREQRLAHIRDCRRHGGFWTPVGGNNHGPIYGCVFPPSH